LGILLGTSAYRDRKRFVEVMLPAVWILYGCLYDICINAVSMLYIDTVWILYGCRCCI
jgi:hypothetical protein